MVYPPTVGTSQGQLLISGPRDVYQECAPIFKCLGGDVRYLGSTIGAAATLDLAVVSRLVANTLGIVYGLYICESEDVSLQQFADMYPEGDRARHLASVIDKDDFEKNISATVETSIEVVSAIRNFAVEIGIDSDFPDFLLNLYQRAAAAGYGKQDNASLIKVFRG